MADLAMLALSLVAVVGVFFSLRSDDDEDGEKSERGGKSEGGGETEDTCSGRGWVRVDGERRG